MNCPAGSCEQAILTGVQSLFDAIEQFNNRNVRPKCLRLANSALIREMPLLTDGEIQAVRAKIPTAREVYLNEPRHVLDATTTVALALTQDLCTSHPHPQGEQAVAARLAKHGVFRKIVRSLSEKAALQKASQIRQEKGDQSRPVTVADLLTASPAHAFGYKVDMRYGEGVFEVAYVVVPRSDTNYIVAFGKGVAIPSDPQNISCHDLRQTAINRLSKCPGTLVIAAQPDEPIAKFYQRVEDLIRTTKSARGRRLPRVKPDLVRTSPYLAPSIFLSPIEEAGERKTGEIGSFSLSGDVVSSSTSSLTPAAFEVDNRMSTVVPVYKQDTVHRMASSFGEPLEPVQNARLIAGVRKTIVMWLASMYGLDEKHANVLSNSVSRSITAELCNMTSVAALQLIRYNNPVKTFVYTIEDVRTVVAYTVSQDKVYFAKATTTHPEQSIGLTAKIALRRLLACPVVRKLSVANMGSRDLESMLRKAKERRGNRPRPTKQSS